MDNLPQLEMTLLTRPEALKQIKANTRLYQYWSIDWSGEFYRSAAYQGFISTAVVLDLSGASIPVLLPELQNQYALLHWPNLHCSRHVRKLIKRLSPGWVLKIASNPERVMQAIHNSHKRSWLISRYQQLMLELSCDTQTDFCIHAIELLNPVGEMVAGELGYSMGRTYTSLSGFFSRKKEHSNLGTLQLLWLAKVLEQQGAAFWNLGHPFMEYKIRLGANIVERKDFLKLWEDQRDEPSMTINGIYELQDLQKINFPS